MGRGEKIANWEQEILLTARHNQPNAITSDEIAPEIQRLGTAIGDLLCELK